MIGDSSTRLHARMLSGGCGHFLIHDRIPLPTGDPWRPSDGLRVFSVVLEKTGVSEVGPRDPCSVLWPVPHPVHQVMEPPFTAADREDPADLPDQVATLKGTKVAAVSGQAETER